MKFPTNEIVEAIASVLPERRPIGHHDPWIRPAEIEAVSNVLETGTLSYRSIDLFEERITSNIGVRHCIAVSSGTAALHLALLGLGVGAGDTVICPSLTFAGCAAAIRYCGGTPFFVDGRITINPYKLRQLLGRIPPDQRPKFAIIVDLLGYPADWPALKAVADDFGIRLLEDACQALGSRLDGKPCGSLSSTAVFSFNNNKIATTNGGGCVVTNDDRIAAHVRRLATTGRVVHPWLVAHDLIGFNYRMGSINAALGLAQLADLPERLGHKRELHSRYRAALAPFHDVVELLDGHSNSDDVNHWLNAILVAPRFASQYERCRDELLTALHAEGILARAIFTPLHMQEPYKAFPKDTNMLYCEDTWKRMICLPSSPDLI